MICPDCIEELIPNRKKLGHLVRWFICPKCGYRVRENSEHASEFKEYSRVIDERHINNLTGSKKEIL